jgi:hypothetical protein
LLAFGEAVEVQCRRDAACGKWDSRKLIETRQILLKPRDFIRYLRSIQRMQADDFELKKNHALTAEGPALERPGLLSMNDRT